MYKSSRETWEKRLWGSIDIAGEDECWLWNKPSVNKGYPVVRDYEGTHRQASRVIWEVVHKEKPPRNLMVCHHCDTPLCLNPKHLYLGTPKQNAADYVKRLGWVGRRGEKHQTAKLTEAQVREIMARSQAGEGANSLAARFGVAPQTICGIAKGRNWTHLFSTKNDTSTDSTGFASRRYLTSYAPSKTRT